MPRKDPEARRAYDRSRSARQLVKNMTPAQIEYTRRRNRERLRAKPPEWRAWLNAKQRVTNPKDPRWPNYGGRGIRMCQEWLDSFEAFLSYIGPRPDGTSLDRINNDGNYEPGNVRWATAAEQRRNQRRQRRASAS